MKPGKELLEACIKRMDREQLDQLCINAKLTLSIEAHDHVYVGDGMVRGPVGVTEFSVSRVDKWNVPVIGTVLTVAEAEAELKLATDALDRKKVEGIEKAEAKAAFEKKEAERISVEAQVKADAAQAEADVLKGESIPKIPDPAKGSNLPWMNKG